jgi:hypothetical protein
VIPGIVAIRAPRRDASTRAVVWLSENVVGAKMTEAEAIASATSRGGSSPCRVLRANASTRALRALPAAASAIASAIASCSSLQSTSTSSSGPTARQDTAASAERITAPHGSDVTQPMTVCAAATGCGSGRPSR